MRLLGSSLFLSIVNYHTFGHFAAIGVSGTDLRGNICEGRGGGLILEVAGLNRKAMVVGRWVRIGVIIWFRKVGFERKVGVAGIVFESVGLAGLFEGSWVILVGELGTAKGWVGIDVWG